MVREKLILKKIIILSLILFLSCFNVNAEVDLDQWEDSQKSYKDLIDEGFEVKAYDMNTINLESGLVLMFFVTVLQKKQNVYECQEYQTMNNQMETLDLSIVCRRLVQPYNYGLGT